jgi:hypothetical protein
MATPDDRADWSVSYLFVCLLACRYHICYRSHSYIVNTIATASRADSTKGACRRTAGFSRPSNAFA